MIAFLKSFFANEKSADEKALLTKQTAEKERDILRLDVPESAEETQSGCGTGGGCGRCGCR